MDNTYKVQFRVVLSSTIVLLISYQFPYAKDYASAVSLGKMQLAQTLSNLGYDGYGKRITRVTVRGNEEW